MTTVRSPSLSPSATRSLFAREKDGENGENKCFDKASRVFDSSRDNTSRRTIRPSAPRRRAQDRGMLGEWVAWEERHCPAGGRLAAVYGRSVISRVRTWRNCRHASAHTVATPGFCCRIKPTHVSFSFLWHGCAKGRLTS